MRGPRAVVLVTAVAAVLAAAPAARADSTAVVLVSGFTTTTPYTAPGQLCTGSEPYGGTWSFIAGQLQSQGNAVYTAPVNDGPGTPVPDPPNFSNCPTPPPGTTINSRGDIYANATALASFLGYLKQTFGVTSVHLVGHSYGGMWSRGAVRLKSTYFPDVKALSLTTMGSPHLGDFYADIAEGVDPALCGDDLACKLFVDLLVAEREAKFEPALSQISASFVAQWNAGQGTSLSGVPVSAIAGDAVTFLGQSNPYVSPNDAIVGIGSAQATGLDTAGVIPTLSCFKPFPDVHSATELPFFPLVKHGLTTDPASVTAIQQNIGGKPAPLPCPTSTATASFSPRAQSAAASASRSIVLRRPLRQSGRTLPATRRHDVLLLKRGTRVRCGNKQLDAIPLHGSRRVAVIPRPRCGRRLRVNRDAGSVLHTRRTRTRATVQVSNGRLRIRSNRLPPGGRLVAHLRVGRRLIPLRLDRNGRARTKIRGTARLRVVLERHGRRTAAAVIALEL